MPVRHDDFCLPGLLFFDHPVVPAGAATSAADGYAAAAPLPGPDWSAHLDGAWRLLHPAGAELPEQGWKVHVSAVPEHAERVLRATHAYCAEHRLHFKHLRDPRTLLRAGGKYAPRGSSGKFVTIYPRGEEALAGVLHTLGPRLSGTPGPYILSDLRIGDGPLHVRYGGFRPLELDDGEDTVAAIRAPDGTLVPDRRLAGFRIPDWVTPPAVLARHLAAGRGGTLPFRVTGALHFSNGGGVYRAVRPDGRAVLVKEARPHAGLDAHGHDAVRRLRREHAAGTALAGLPGIPEVHELHAAWEHLFLVRQHVAGRPLGGWLARHYPLHGGDAAAYFRRATAVADRLDEVLAGVHRRGWVFGDLHPRNVVIDDDDRPWLIDAEQAFPIHADDRPGLGAPGFRAPRTLRGFDLDRYAAAALRLWLLVPLAAMTEVAPQATATHLRYAARRFPLPQATARRLHATLTGSRTPSPPAPPVPADRAALRDGLVRAILAGATPDRADRLFPGDAEQFASGGAGLGYGAAGVLLALHRAGVPIAAEFRTWLCRHAAGRVAGTARLEPAAVAPHPRSAAAASRPGLWTGGHGIAYVLDLLGHEDDADRVLGRCAPAPDRPVRPGLAGGLTGIAWALAAIAVRRGRASLLDEAVALAERVAAAPAETASGFGLLRGWTGPALLAVRLFEATGERRWLDRADVFLRRDLAACVPVPGGGDQVHDGHRTLCHLDAGSAGLAVAAARLARHRPDTVGAAALPGLLAACRPAFIVYPGLMSGRAGLLVALAEADPGAVPDPHDFELHTVPYAGGLAVPGVALRRLSMDLHTGSAGVLLALSLPAAPAAGPSYPEVDRARHP